MDLLYKLRTEIKELRAQVDYLSTRHPLPDTRDGTTRKVDIGGKELYITTGNYPDGELGELFIKVGKQGNEDAIYDLVAISLSVGLQYGIDLQEYVSKYKHQRMPCGGVTSDPDVPMCSSVIDYVARRLELDYLKGDE